VKHVKLSANPRAAGSLQRFFKWAGARLGEDQNIPHLSVFTASTAFSFPKDFSVSDYSGLLFCHVSKDGPVEKLVAYWADEQHFAAHVEIFKSKLSLHGPYLAGAIIEVHRSRPRFWSRHKLGTWILALAAFVGALSALRDYSAVLLAAPDVVLTQPDAGRLDIVEGTGLAALVSASSEVRTTPSKISFVSAKAKARTGGSVFQLRIEPDVVRLPAGQTITVKMFGTAPEHSKGQGAPDVYELEVNAQADTGIFRRVRPIDTSREVWVWAAKDQIGMSRWQASNSAKQECKFVGTLYSAAARPQGIPVEIRLSSMLGMVTAVYVWAPSASIGLPLTVNDEGVTTRKFEFQTAQLENFSQYQLQVTLQMTESVTKEVCERQAANVKVSFP
jgi:hypothetical protein